MADLCYGVHVPWKNAWVVVEEAEFDGPETAARRSAGVGGWRPAIPGQMTLCGRLRVESGAAPFLVGLARPATLRLALEDGAYQCDVAFGALTLHGLCPFTVVSSLPLFVSGEPSPDVDLARRAALCAAGDEAETLADPAWLAWGDGTVRRLAEAIRADWAFDRLPILADALEEAGCAEAAVLDHCRGPGPHTRGCWVLALLLDQG